MDYSVMGKVLVRGRDAEKYLNPICANDIAVPVGKIVYTQWLNKMGFIEADLTVTRLAEDQFLILSGDNTINAVIRWLKRNIPSEAHVHIHKMTSDYSVLNLQGPNSRDLLSKVTHADISNQAFPFMTMQEIDIGYSLVKALRVTYVGELGYELYIPTEFSLHVFDTLIEAGEAFDLKLIGLQALNSLRLEKAYRDYGGDIDNTDNPLAIGLSRFVDFDKPRRFHRQRSAAGKESQRIGIPYAAVPAGIPRTDDALWGNYLPGRQTGRLYHGRRLRAYPGRFCWRRSGRKSRRTSHPRLHQERQLRDRYRRGTLPRQSLAASNV